MSAANGNVMIMASPPVPRQRDDADSESPTGEFLSADLLRQVRARRRQAKARRAAVLRSLALLRSSGYRDS
jgi:hypothetical protein